MGKTRPSFSVFKSIPFDENHSYVSQGPNFADNGPKSSFDPLGYPCQFEFEFEFELEIIFEFKYIFEFEIEFVFDLFCNCLI